MTLRKHGVGEILPEDDQQHTAGKQEWSETDEDALQEENEK